MEQAPSYDMSGGAPELTLASRPVSVINSRTKVGLGSATLDEMPTRIAVSAGAVRNEIVHAVEVQLGPEDILGPDHHVDVDAALIAEINEAGRELEAEMATTGGQPNDDPIGLFATDPLFGEAPLFGAAADDSEAETNQTAETVSPQALVAAPIGELSVRNEIEAQAEDAVAPEVPVDSTESETGAAELPGFRFIAIGELSVLAAGATDGEMSRAIGLADQPEAAAEKDDEVDAPRRLIAAPLGELAIVDAVETESNDAALVEPDVSAAELPGLRLVATSELGSMATEAWDETLSGAETVAAAVVSHTVELVLTTQEEAITADGSDATTGEAFPAVDEVEQALRAIAERAETEETRTVYALAA